MAKQRHDLGVQKKGKGRKRLSKKERWEARRWRLWPGPHPPPAHFKPFKGT